MIVQCVIFSKPDNYLHFGGHLLTSDEHRKDDFIVIGSDVFGINDLTGQRVSDIKSQLRRAVLENLRGFSLDQYPLTLGRVTLSLATGLFEFAFHENGRDVVKRKDAMSSAEVAALCKFLNLPTQTRKKDNLEAVMTRLYSLAPKDFPLTRALHAPAVAAPPVRECAHPDCIRPLDETRRYYCSKHHKQEVIKLWRDQEKRAMGVYLAELLLYESLHKRANNLQPLATFAGEPPQLPSDMTNMEVFKLYEPYIDLLLTALGAKLDGGRNVAQEDQISRAVRLAGMFSPKHHTTVRLMDGHGGFLFLFIRELIKKLQNVGMGDEEVTKVINKIRIEVVDIDPEVTKWHARMYPAFKCRTEDIFTRRRLSRKTLLYANFCGVSKSWDGVKAFLMDMQRLNIKQMMISFANRGAIEYHRSLRQICNHAGLHSERLDTQRRNFSTYVVSCTLQR